MPYIITTSQDHPHWGFYGRKEVSRTAVATPDDARRAIIAIGEQHDTWIGGDALHGPIDRNSGTIGPLPDGTVIEVRQASWFELRRMTGRAPGESLGADARETRTNVLAAFNGSQL